MTRRRPTAAVIALTALAAGSVAGCSSPTACPAVGYSTTVTVTLADDWPGRAGLTLDVGCATEGSSAGGSSAEGSGPASCTLTGRSDGPSWAGSAISPPAAVDVTVRRGVEILDRRTVTLEPRVTEHPYGARCGGPALADVTVPAP